MRSFKQQCIELRQKDLSLNEIMSILERPKTSIYQHIKNIPLSEKKQREIANNSKKRALRLSSLRKGISSHPYKPFSKWTPDMVLLTAHYIFDGGLSKSCVYNNRNDTLLDRVENLMKQVYDFKPKYYKNPISGVGRISYHNIAMSNFFIHKKRELLNSIIKSPAPLQTEFLRAFFDDEGCMDYRVSKRIRKIRGYQRDIKILKIIQKLLKNFDIEAKLQGKNEVVIMGKENLQKFQQKINFSYGVKINPNRTNSVWKKDFAKRELLAMAINSFKT